DFLSKTEKSKGRLLSLAVALIAPVAISLIVAVGVQESGQEVNVVLVQPNFEPHYEKFHIPDEILVQRFLSLAEEKVDEHTDYLIFPETSFGRVDMDGLKGHNVMLDLQSFLAQYPDLNIVTGLAGYRWLTDRSEQELATSRRLLNSEGQTTYVETYNCAIQMDFDGRISEYYKALFVPGAEFFPFRRILFFLKPLVDKLGGTIAGYRTRSKHNVFAAGDVIAAPAICYESIFGEFMSRFIRKQANVIFIMTNDGWWDNTAGHKQHALFARLRAIELRRGIARSANMGTCCFIDQKGTIYNPTEYGIEQSISGIVQTNDEVTFYASWGDFIGRISLFVAGLLLLRSLVHRFTK
ncbi:MAG: apolipoprotein N-acyltransferase, partial [Saprospiraceae bacterium]|nr:apolipoprotein N-acyltransferase [Saprospiraceae bacterium]